MARDISRDDEFFNCEQEHELRYVSGLYAEHQRVYDFLKQKCANNQIKYSTHRQVYELIRKELGFPLPN